MVKREIDPETANEIAKALAELRAQLESQKKAKRKSTTQTKKKRASKQSTSTKKIKSLNDETVLNTNPDNNKKTKESSSTDVPHLIHFHRADVFGYEMEFGDNDGKFPNMLSDVEETLRKYVQKKYENENNLLKIITEKSNENDKYAKRILKNFKEREKSGLTDHTNLIDAMNFGDLINYADFYNTNTTLYVILDLIRTFRNFLIGHPGKEPYFDMQDEREGFSKFLFYACCLADSLMSFPNGSWALMKPAKAVWEGMPIELKNAKLAESKKIFLAAPPEIQERYRKYFETPEYDQIE